MKSFFFGTPNEFEIGFKTLDKSRSVLYLLDYELFGDSKTGLDVAEQFDVGSNAILVTSHWDEILIQNRCVALGIGLIPKGLVGFVPISSQKPVQKFDGVLLDDDPLITLVWSNIAKQNNKKFVSFAEPDEFFSALNEIDISSPIFIDSDLKNNVKGQELVIKVRALNFKKIYLTTGYEPESFAFIPGLTAIVGKHPPKEIGGVGNDMQ